MFDDLGECRDKLYFSSIGEVAAKDGVMYRISEAFHGFVHMMQALWVHYVVADYVAFQPPRFMSSQVC